MMQCKTIGILLLCLPLIVSSSCSTYDGFKRDLIWLTVFLICGPMCKVTANPEYMFPILHAIYPIVCAGALLCFSFELFFWYVVKAYRQINKNARQAWTTLYCAGVDR